jgi:molybdopterin converting factor small subunit
MIIHVKTIGTLKSLEEGSRVVSIEIPRETSVESVIQRLRLKDWEIGFILINQIRGNPESILNDQDELTIIAPLAGG